MTRARDTSPRLEAALERLSREARVGLMAHIVLGYPSLEESRRLVEAMARSGADLIEVQIPFSDPTADGPVITAACQRALDGGIRVRDALAFLETMAARHPLPFFVMSYFNLLFAYRGGGVRGFARDAAAAGASGLIVPDVPPEAREEGYPEACRDSGLHPIYVVSPNSSDKRLRLVREVASGFIYATSRTGTTGREMELAREQLHAFLERARRLCGLPFAVGFSISRRDQVEALRGDAEIAVVGTHLIRAYERGGVEGVAREVRVLAGREAVPGPAP